MKRFQITSHAGVDMGIYKAEDESGALDAMARDAGYASQADADARGIAPFEGRIEEWIELPRCEGCAEEMEGLGEVREGKEGPVVLCARCARQYDESGEEERLEKEAEE